MKTTASSGGKTATTGSVIAKDPTALVIPIRAIEGVEGLALGLRQEMLTIGDGNVATGAGCGTDFIILRWGKGDKERQAMVRGSELLKAWVATFSPEDAEQFPEAVRAVDRVQFDLLAGRVK